MLQYTVLLLWYYWLLYTCCTPCYRLAPIAYCTTGTVSAGRGLLDDTCMHTPHSQSRGFGALGYYWTIKEETVVLCCCFLLLFISPLLLRGSHLWLSSFLRQIFIALLSIGIGGSGERCVLVLYRDM